MKSLVKLGKGNAKLGKKIYTFSLPAGYSCPGAKDCKSKAVRVNDKWIIKDSSTCTFRCFAASQEAMYPPARNMRHANFDALKAAGGVEGMRKLIQAAIDATGKLKGTLRIHPSGDFYSQNYFDAWRMIARDNPQWLFYGYTKSIKYWVARMNDIPDNMVLTASYGGKYDGYIEPTMRTATVVFHPDMAESMGLEIDHDDSHAMKKGDDFALLLHGVQPAGSFAGEAKRRLNQLGWKGYSK